MSNPYRDKLLGIGVISKRSRPVVREGREHPETGARWKSTTDELGNVVTQHNTKDDRQDVLIKAPTVKVAMQQREER